MIKDQYVIVETDDVMLRHQVVLQALISVGFPLSMLMQFLVDVIASEKSPVRQQLCPLLVDWYNYINASIFNTDVCLGIMRSPAFDVALYDLYLNIANTTQTLLTAPLEQGVVSQFMFDGWINRNLRLKRHLLIPKSTYNVNFQ